MHALMLILTVGMLIWSGISVMTYQARKGDSKREWKAFAASHAPTRQLTAEERTTIGKAFKKTAPRDDNVFAIHGPATRHGLENSRGPDQWHLLIGGIEIKPFPQWALLVTDDNQVEVVQAVRGNALIPVRFNGIGLHEMLAAKTEQAQVEALANRRLNLGERGSVDIDHRPPAFSSTNETATTLPGAEAEEAAGVLPPQEEARLLSRRDETPVQAALRQGHGDGWGLPTVLTGVLILLATLATMAHGAASWMALVLALAALGCAAWLWRRLHVPRPPAPAKLRTLRGPITVRLRTSGNEANPDIHADLLLGDVKILFPPEWRKLAMQPGSTHRVEVDTRHHVVGFDHLSLYDMLKRFPRRRWGYWLVLPLLMVPVLFTALHIAPSPVSSLQLGFGHLRSGTQHLRADSPESVRQAHLRIGDFVELTGTASCDANDVYAARAHIHDVMGNIPLDCRQLGWRSAPLPLDQPALPPAVTALSDLAERLQPKPNERQDRYPSSTRDAYMMALMGAMYAQTIDDFNARVLDVASVCPTAQDSDCALLRRAMTILAGHDDDWDTTLDQAKSGTLEASLRIAGKDKALLHNLLRDALEGSQKEAWKSALVAAAKAQPAALLIRGDERFHMPADAYPGATVAAGLSAQQATRALTALSFAVRGEVVRYDEGQGTPSLHIHAQNQPNNAIAWLLPPVALLSSLLVLLWSIIRLVAARRYTTGRTAAIAQYLGQGKR